MNYETQIYSGTHYRCAQCHSWFPRNWVEAGDAVQSGTQAWCSAKCHETYAAMERTRWACAPRLQALRQKA